MKTQELIVSIFQVFLNVSLIVLAFVLSYYMILELKDIIVFMFLEQKAAFNEFLEKILVFFLYFEFIALIIKYFKEHYHFPLRYFMYIGITAMIRVIIIDHENPNGTLMFSLSVLVLVIGYTLIRISSNFVNQKDA